MAAELSALLKEINYEFKDRALLEQALSHRSIFGDIDNERLEFLGDSILSMVISEALFQYHPCAKEGELSRMRASLVSGVCLHDVAKELNLGSYIRLGPGELKSGGQQRASILADALEALIGAIYLDSDLNTTRQCIFKWYGKRLEELAEIPLAKDAKSRLQEWVQAHKFPLPTYTASVSGPPHQQTFTVTCKVEGLLHQTTGCNTSRRRAEQVAALHYLELIQ